MPLRISSLYAFNGEKEIEKGYHHLIKDGKLGLEQSTCYLLDFLITSRFLTSKLIARERKYLKS